MEIQEELIKKSKTSPQLSKPNLSKEEKQLVQRISIQTSLLNRNNVTRTKAYLDFYKNHPEIHWAFLGHMVSRNGGWNMTDLKGEFLSVLLTKQERKSFFSFLERGNWLIFQDAYPQFLLYEESMKRGTSLFHLMSWFNISTFMETIWNHFLRNHDRYILTMALVINEQSYLEKRVVHHPFFKKEVFETLEFKLQDLFSFTYILFPYIRGGKIGLTGQVLKQFDRLDARIRLGQRLYTILFKDKTRLNQCKKWAFAHPHTGSRKDYWPQLFHHVKEGVPGKGYQMRLKSCRIKSGAARLYSPELQYVWKDTQHPPAEAGDWFQDWKIIDYLIKTDEIIDGEIKNEYCKALENLEMAVIAKKTLSIFI
jgi:hypothetical protein